MAVLVKSCPLLRPLLVGIRYSPAPDELGVLGAYPLSPEDKRVSGFRAVREALWLGQRPFGLDGILTNSIQVSIWGRGHRVNLEEKRLTIEWEISRGSVSDERAADLAWKRTIGWDDTWIPSDYVVDVQLAE
jgi:hypothetical protein